MRGDIERKSGLERLVGACWDGARAEVGWALANKPSKHTKVSHQEQVCPGETKRKSSNRLPRALVSRGGRGPSPVGSCTALCNGIFLGQTCRASTPDARAAETEIRQQNNMSTDPRVCARPATKQSGIPIYYIVQVLSTMYIRSRNLVLRLSVAITCYVGFPACRHLLPVLHVAYVAYTMYVVYLQVLVHDGAC